ncbi:MAG: transporter substrate-binding domain-containing protein [Alteromonadaceae bacterium]|nr:transporter substrate-binding domain-containing protein [Alteromonadaceae bacterium]
MASFCALAEATSPLIVRYPLVKNVNLYKNQSAYFHELFKLALDNSGIDYKLEYVSVPSLPQSRSAKLIDQQVYDAHWMTTSSEREAALLPVRIPLLKGLLGLRVGLVRQENITLGNKVIQSSDLNNFRVGQGHDWTDTQILQANNIEVVKAASTVTLYDMLRKNRIDYLPRSVIEVQSELEVAADPDLMLEPDIALYYPQAVYFFTHPDNIRLNNAIKTGLETAIQNGQFDTLFNSYFAESLKQANMDERRIIRLRNNTLPFNTPLETKEYWYAEALLSSQKNNAG